jgi:hypothetical protein
MPEEKDSEKKSRPPWLTNVVVAISVLLVMLAVVAILYGRDVIERPILALFVLLAWLGALVGLKVPGSTRRQ